jgi:hypothetical protein
MNVYLEPSLDQPVKALAVVVELGARHDERRTAPKSRYVRADVFTAIPLASAWQPCYAAPAFEISRACHFTYRR